MEVTKRAGGAAERLKDAVKKLGGYQYALAVVLFGALLMLLPRGCETSAAQQPAVQTVQSPSEQTLLESEQARLAAILSRVDGAGKCEVLLSVDYGREQLYQTDEESRSADGEQSTQLQTVFAQTSGSEKQPVVRVTRWPVYKGAIIVCEGADRPAVKLKLIEAVSSLTGLGSDKISVLKMKG